MSIYWWKTHVYPFGRPHNDYRCRKECNPTVLSGKTDFSIEFSIFRPPELQDDTVESDLIFRCRCVRENAWFWTLYDHWYGQFDPNWSVGGVWVVWRWCQFAGTYLKKKSHPSPCTVLRGRYTGRGGIFFDVVLFTACFVHTTDAYTFIFEIFSTS